MTEPLITYLRTHRKRSCLSQDEIAFLLGGMCGTNVSRHELGKRIPLVNTALCYEFLFGVSVSDLYVGVFHQVRNEVSERARILRRSLERKGQCQIRDHKIAFLRKLVG